MSFRKGAWWHAVPHTETFDLIVSNPPYIATEAIDDASPEVRVFDPQAGARWRLGRARGLSGDRVAGDRAGCNPGGTMLLEIGSTQGEAVSARSLAGPASARIEVLKDLAGP